eukprot:s1891_g5.t1
MEPVAQEVFKQRLYELAKDNEAKQTQDPPPREAVTSGDDVLEGMLNDLLGALRREAPMDPLPAEKVAAIKATAAQEATATGSEPAESQGAVVDGRVDQASEAADGPETTGPGLLAAVRAAESIMKGDQGRAEPGKN